MQRTTKSKQKIETSKQDWLEADDREICIGVIVNDNLCGWAEANWPLSLLETRAAQTIVNWVYEYYRKYKQAPGKNLEKIVEDEEKHGRLVPDVLDELKTDILPYLSEQYEKDANFNPDYLLDRMKDELHRRQLKDRNEAIEELIRNNELNEAGKLLNVEIPGTVNRLNKYILSINEMKLRDKKRPLLLMKPWLRLGQFTFIYGDYGTGKSLLAINIAYLLGLEKYGSVECDVGEWQVKNTTGCLYIDGELGEVELRERISQFEWLGKQQENIKIMSFPLPEYQLATEDTFYLSERKNQLQIIQWLKEHPLYKLLILDSVNTLFGLDDENSNSEWSQKINPFLRDLRALEMAVIILHHSGKDSKRGLRGATAMGAMVHNIFRLTNHPDKDIDEGEAWFVLSKDKQRSAGFSFKKFAIHYTQNSALTETDWEITEGGKKKYGGLDSKQIRIVKHLFHGKLTQTEIAERVECTQGHISNTKTLAKELSYMKQDGTQTALWDNLISTFANVEDGEE